MNILTFKCWGAGGGGGKLSDLTSLADSTVLSQGGGGAFAQVSLSLNLGFEGLFSIMLVS